MAWLVQGGIGMQDAAWYPTVLLVTVPGVIAMALRCSSMADDTITRDVVRSAYVTCPPPPLTISNVTGPRWPPAWEYIIALPARPPRVAPCSISNRSREPAPSVSWRLS